MVIIIASLVLFLFLFPFIKELYLNWRRKSLIKYRGKIGENIVSNSLLSYGGKILNNYMILDSRNKSHQIDHVFVNQHGIFVIETKTYSGTIYGTKYQQYWTHVLSGGRLVKPFYNPTKQNATHYYQIKNLFSGYSYDYLPIYSCVVFVDGNIDNVDADNVFKVNELIDFIDNKPVKLSEVQVENIYNYLKENESSEITEKEHLQSIKNTMEDIENNICPRCNGKLVIKNSKNGQFYGCSNYPKCKFTKRVDEYNQ